MQHSLVEQQVICMCTSNDSVDVEQLIHEDSPQRDEVCACFAPGYFVIESIVLLFISQQFISDIVLVMNKCGGC